jgi:hypothetical protein
MSMPSIESMRSAAEWLRCYDEESDAYGQMVEVAVWLDSQADAKDERAFARQNGVPVSALRKVLQEAGDKKGVA